MTIEEIIKKFSSETGFEWGINTVMASIRPGCLYQMYANEGEFTITDWPDNQWSDKSQSYIDAPTSREIRDEYIRQQTIAEFLDRKSTRLNSSHT